MKFKFLPAFLVATGILFTSALSAQKAFEGTIKYEMDYEEVPEQLEGMESMLPKEMSMVMSKNKVKVIQSVMGGSQIVIMDKSTKSSTLLMDMMGQKIMMKMSEEDMAEGKEEGPDPKITYSNDRKKIAGYSCKKAIMEVEEGDEFEIWYTDDIPSDNSDKVKGLKGFPLEYYTVKDGMTIKITATEVSKGKVSAKEFEVPEGYTEMSPEELQGAFGGE